MSTVENRVPSITSHTGINEGRSTRWIGRLLFPCCLGGGVAIAWLALATGKAVAGVVLTISLAALAIVAVGERFLPFCTDWNRSKGDVRADMGSLLCVAVGLEGLLSVLSPVLAVAVYAQLDHSALRVLAFPTHWPVLLQVLLLVLLADLAKYWLHRWSHEHRLGWRLHSIHHAVKRVYWLNGFRIHPLYHLATFVLGLLPWLCLGVSPEVVALYNVALAISAAFQHANIDLDNGWLNYVFNTNELHRWHHSRRLEESNANYGAILIVWDLLFGTYRRAQPAQPSEIGMEVEADYPFNSYAQQLAIPFLSRFWKRIERDAPH